MVAGGGPADPIAVAHARLLADPSIQFAWSIEPRPPPPPSWLAALLKAIFHTLQAVAPVVRIGFWAVLVIGLAALVVLLVRQLLVAPERTGRRQPLTLQQSGLAQQSAARAIVRLAEADQLAAEQRYEAAVHLLLLRGVADLEGGRPGRIRPSLTSRDIAALADIPPEPRAAFAKITAVVESALFGGRPVDRDGWTACRSAYETLARPQAWSVAAAGASS